MKVEEEGSFGRRVREWKRMMSENVWGGSDREGGVT
jgi:hypothetical protein